MDAGRTCERWSVGSVKRSWVRVRVSFVLLLLKKKSAMLVSKPARCVYCLSFTESTL